MFHQRRRANACIKRWPENIVRRMLGRLNPHIAGGGVAKLADCRQTCVFAAAARRPAVPASFRRSGGERCLTRRQWQLRERISTADEPGTSSWTASRMPKVCPEKRTILGGWFKQAIRTRLWIGDDGWSGRRRETGRDGRQRQREPQSRESLRDRESLGDRDEWCSRQTAASRYVYGLPARYQGCPAPAPSPRPTSPPVANVTGKGSANQPSLFAGDLQSAVAPSARSVAQVDSVRPHDLSRVGALALQCECRH